MLGKKSNYILFFLFLSLILNNPACSKQKNFHRCGIYDKKVMPKVQEGIPNKEGQFKFKRKLDSDGFKDFNIYLELENLESEIEENGLSKYHDLFINSMKKAANTLTKLLKVKPNIDSNPIIYIKDEDLTDLEITKWDKTKFGDDAFTNNRVSLNSLDIDLVIVGKIYEVDPLILASAGARKLNDLYRPFLGIVYINKNVDYSMGKMKEYLDTTMIHEFTHILGFEHNFFVNYYKNIYYEKDSLGVERAYINSAKVLEVAKKYFNCSTIKGVPLEEYGGEGTEGSHWEAKVLLGEYMNGFTYSEEQVISEFTLALLEDTGYYKPFYYTGGLMRYGKHKGCSFVEDSCVDKTTHQINPKFENEFYDSLYSANYHDSSCSSGRQSRTYYTWWIYPDLEETSPYYVYFEDKTYGGFGPADYCPVARGMPEEEETAYYTGQCNAKGNGGYGTFIYYDSNQKFSSESLASITGETYSDHSFCFLSSLVKMENENSALISKVSRATCYNIFCSDQSLTIQINDDYFVCPRAGGKIELDGYYGFFLCPDYNLMCSGTVICNDIFDCVEKESLVKESSYYYDYEITTSQNLKNAVNGITNIYENYELSDIAACPQFCSQCKENQKCVKCRPGYVFLGDKLSPGIIDCTSEIMVSHRAYKTPENIYYWCISNCEVCSDGATCETCYDGYTYYNNKCIKAIENCKDYDNNEACIKCNDNYGFNKNNTKECVNINSFSDYYSNNGGINYYPCNETISDCQKCYYNETDKKVNCFLCQGTNLLALVENTCYSKEYIDSDPTYYYINSTHVKLCFYEIGYCDQCESPEECTSCITDYTIVNNDTKTCVEISKLGDLDEYYSNDKNTIYYSCNNSLYNSIAHCKKCKAKDSCDSCQDDFTFINGDKSVCVSKEELKVKYILDPNNENNYIKCSDFINNCDTCNSENCTLCNENYIFINDVFSECVLKSSIDLSFYFTNDGITYYSCKDTKYQVTEKCQEILNPKIPTTIPKVIPTTIPKIVPTTIPKVIPTTIPKIIPTTIPKVIPTTIPKVIPTTIPKILPTTIPKIPSTIPKVIPTTIPKVIPTTIPKIVPTTIPKIIPTTIPKIIPTTIPKIIPTTIPKIIPTTIIKRVYTTLLVSPTDSITIASTQAENKIPTTIPRIIPTTIIRSNPTQIKQKVFFLLQAQIIDNKLIIFLILNFTVKKSNKFTFDVTLYSSRIIRNLQNGQETKELIFSPKEDYDGNGDKIVSLVSDEEIEEERVVVGDLKSEDEIEVKLVNDNTEVLDTQKVEDNINKGGVDYSKIEDNQSNYNIQQYKITSATRGCEFDLSSEETISGQNKSIELNFQEKETNKIIKADCVLSSQNGKKIICSLDDEIDGNYNLEPYIYSDQKETITIVQKNTDDYLTLECIAGEIINNNLRSNNKKSSGLSAGEIVGIVLACVFVVVVIVIYSLFLRKGRQINNFPKSEIYDIKTNQIANQND